MYVAPMIRPLKSKSRSKVVLRCRLLRRALFSILASVLASVLVMPLGAVAATAEKVDLELILAVDISGSIDYGEAQLQRQGYLRAIVDPRIVKIITSGERRKIAITYMEWAGAHHQRVIADWAVIRDLASAKAFAATIARTPITTERWTSISSAIDFAMKHFKTNPHQGTRRVIDISGDGKNNSGDYLRPARDRAVKAGVVINGLPIMNDRPNPWGMVPPKDLDRYYYDNVVGGPGSFIVVARGFKSFGDAVKAKLAREIAGTDRLPRWVPAALR